MVELVVSEEGLRRSHDPINPTLQDIAPTPRLGQLADRVVLQTRVGSFLLKGRVHPGEPHSQLYPTRVTFDGRSLEITTPSMDDLDTIRVMEEAIAVAQSRMK